jgi:hypothetical protein
MAFNWRMPTDAERWRFLADHALTLHTDGGDYGYMVHWCRTAGPGQPPKFYPVSNGRTAEEAIDAAIGRWESKQRRLRQMDDKHPTSETIIAE